MRCVVTAGPTYEPLDQVRRLTNFSTGRLGSELVNFLSARGHDAILLVGQQATWRGERHAARVETFTTTADLRERLEKMRANPPDAVFHAAAVSDFTFGKIFARSSGGELAEVRSGKLTTRGGSLLAELIPTPKIISKLRGWFPQAFLAGWKYEVEGTRQDVVVTAQRQLAECRTDVCVANGPAYGPGFGVVRSHGAEHTQNPAELFAKLEAILCQRG
jgi:phosphopantothenoylcysteine decarboxylase/phosphopantothenate--cysteine ligase